MCLSQWGADRVKLRYCPTMSNGDTITVGRASIGFATAVEWLSAYTDAESNETSSTPYAFPAYDTYEEATNDPNRLSDADLLAPVLLNVGISVRSFYALRRVRAHLEDSLMAIPPGMALVDATPDQVAEWVEPLYAVLDSNQRPSGIQSIKLSKILHRKRPEFLVLHDKWVRACYWGDGARVPRVRKRGAGGYMVAISNAIRDDVASQRSVFEALVDQVPSARTLSRIRVLDILAWRSRGASPTT